MNLCTLIPVINKTNVFIYLVIGGFRTPETVEEIFHMLHRCERHVLYKIYFIRLKTRCSRTFIYVQMSHVSQLRTKFNEIPDLKYSTLFYIPRFVFSLIFTSVIYDLNIMKIPSYTCTYI